MSPYTRVFSPGKIEGEKEYSKSCRTCWTTRQLSSETRRRFLSSDSFNAARPINAGLQLQPRNSVQQRQQHQYQLPACTSVKMNRTPALLARSVWKGKLSIADHSMFNLWLIPLQDQISSRKRVQQTPSM